MSTRRGREGAKRDVEGGNGVGNGEGTREEGWGRERRDRGTEGEGRWGEERGNVPKLPESSAVEKDRLEWSEMDQNNLERSEKIGITVKPLFRYCAMTMQPLCHH